MLVIHKNVKVLTKNCVQASTEPKTSKSPVLSKINQIQDKSPENGLKPTKTIKVQFKEKFQPNKNESIKTASSENQNKSLENQKQVSPVAQKENTETNPSKYNLMKWKLKNIKCRFCTEKFDR